MVLLNKTVQIRYIINNSANVDYPIQQRPAGGADGLWLFLHITAISNPCLILTKSHLIQLYT